MDLINSVTSALGIDATSAQGAVGSVFQLLKQQAPADAFAAVEDKVPEASGWMAAAPAVGGAPAGGGLGGLLGGAAGALGGLGGIGESLAGAAPLAGLLGTLGKLGINADGLGKLLPLVLQFVQSRAGEGVVGKLLSASPALAQLAGKGGGSPLAAGLGALGGLFK